MQTRDHFKTDSINPLGLACLKCRRTKDKKTQRQMLNNFLRQLDATEFKINMFQGIYNDQYFVTVDLDEKEIEREAELSGYMVKVNGLSAKVPFRDELKKRV